MNTWPYYGTCILRIIMDESPMYSHLSQPDALFILRSSQRAKVICAGPERSGSTWLYNAIRLLHLKAKAPSGGKSEIAPGLSEVTMVYYGPIWYAMVKPWPL